MGIVPVRPGRVSADRPAAPCRRPLRRRRRAVRARARRVSRSGEWPGFAPLRAPRPPAVDCGEAL